MTVEEAAAELRSRYEAGELSVAEYWQALSVLEPRPVVEDEPAPIHDPNPKTPFTDLDRRAADLLTQTVLRPGSTHRDFIHFLGKHPAEISVRQRQFLQKLIWRYRAQIFKGSKDSVRDQARLFLGQFK